jgi:hypothetical protein
MRGEDHVADLRIRRGLIGWSIVEGQEPMSEGSVGYANWKAHRG